MIEIPTVQTHASIDDDEEREKFVPLLKHFGAHHLLWLDCLQKVEDGQIKNLLGLMCPGAGKALALDTPIPTPSGWATMGTLKIGDGVFDENGNVCYVTWVSPVWKDRSVYRVKTDCGDEIIADADHEWLVSTYRKPDRPNKRKIRTTVQLVKLYGKRPLIDRAKAIKLPECDFLLDPYVLGVWLGDGSTLFPNITAGDQDADWMVGELQRLGIKISKLKRPSGYSLGMLGIRHKFRTLGFMGGSSGVRAKTKLWGKKFIPKEYLRSSKTQRLSLLQGLIDTDGHVSQSGLIEFTNTNPELAFGVAELVRSLGAKASVIERRVTLNGKDCGPGWRVYFYLENAARMPRKAKLTRNGTRTPNTYVEASPCGRADTICIEVDSPSHLFLCGVSMTPTHNSIYTSVVFPTHFLGRFPKRSVIVASYGSELPKKFGRRARSIVQQSAFKRTFDCTLSEESAAVDEWSLTNGSEWMAAGILTGITGNRADGVIWDDLIKGREQADSLLVRDKTWDAYNDDLLTRKKPNAFEIGITCMTGDTPVTMADGTRRELRHIKKGDLVLSWKDNTVVKREVLNFKSQGSDKIFEIRTGNSKVRANARHPFLVDRGHTLPVFQRKSKEPRYHDDISNFEWVRTKDLKVGDRIVTISKIRGSSHPTLSKDQAWLLGYMFGDGWITVRDTTQKGYKGRIYPRCGHVTCVAESNDVEENKYVCELFRKVFNVKMKLRRSKQFVTEVSKVGRWFREHGLTGKAKSKRLPSYLFSEPEYVRQAFLDGYNDADGHIIPEGRRGAGTWCIVSCNPELLEDVRQLARGLGYRVRNVHVKQKWMQAPNSPKPTFSTQAYLHFKAERVKTDFCAGEITKISEAGREEVFDLQIEGTECFIADGLVSHNTHWHEDDPAGRILPEDYHGESGLIRCRDGADWFVVCIPAIAERADDILGRKIDERVWPEWFPEDHFERFKRLPRTWSSLYQQRPSPDTGDFFQADWLKPWPGNQMPHRDTLHIYGASDYAVTADGGDYTVHVIIGIDHMDRMFLLDLWRQQASSDKWVESLCDLVEKWRPLGWAEEAGQIKGGVGPFLDKRLRERKLYIARKKLPSKADKAIRAQAIRGRMAMNGLYCPFHAIWFSAFKDELMKFNAGKYDDQVDAISLIGQVLDKMVRGRPRADPTEKPKMFSTNAADCTVTLTDMFEANERTRPAGTVRIH